MKMSRTFSEGCPVPVGDGFAFFRLMIFLLLAGITEVTWAESVDFEKPEYVDGKSVVGIDNWVSAASNPAARVECKGQAPGKVLQVLPKVLSAKMTTIFHRKFAVQSGISEMRWRMRTTQGEPSGCMGVSANGTQSERAVEVCMSTGNQMWYRGAETDFVPASGMAWRSGTWYYLRMRLDPSTSTYSLYLDTLPGRTGEITLVNQGRMNTNSQLAYFYICISSETEALNSAMEADDLQWDTPTENYAEWNRSSMLHFNTTATGANVAAAVKDFPLLVRFTSGNFNFAQALAGGKDIRFADKDGTHLEYQIERWDASAKAAEVWVKVPQVDGNSTSDYITMYWGKADALPASNGAKVFSTQSGYLAAWHLGEGGTGTRFNAVGSGNNAVPHNYDGNESRAGVIGLADSLVKNGSSAEYMDLGDGFADFTAGMTLSIWAYPTLARSFGRFFDLGRGPSGDNILFGRLDTSTSVYVDTYTGSVLNRPNLAVPNVLELNRWQHLTVTSTGDGKDVRVYKNGILLKNGGSGFALTKVTRTSNFLGRSNWSGDDYYQGMLDEPQIANVVRSPDWLKLAYETQKAGAHMVSFGSVVDKVLAITSQPASIAVTEGSRAVFEIKAVSASSIAYQWLKNGTALSTVGPTLIIPTARLADAGSYTCRVTDAQGSLLSSSATLTVSENYALWSRSMKINFNTTASGANVAGKVTAFPMLLRLDAIRFNFAEAQPQGRDLRFGAMDGTPLSFQITRWDTTAKLAEIWVRVPEITGNSNEDFITMFWRRSDAVQASNGARVFRGEDGFLGVWHLDEAGQGARFNAVGANNYAVPMGYGGNESVPGVIGFADSLESGGFASGEYLDLGAGFSDFTAGFTYSVWAYPTSRGRYARLLDLGNGVESDNINLFRVETSDDLGFDSYLGALTGNDKLVGAGALESDRWQEFTVTMQGLERRMYKNGALIKSGNSQTAIVKVNRTQNFLGRSPWGIDEYFQGKLDEPRISNVVRSADWIKLAYETQRAGSVAVVYGNVGNVPLPAPQAIPLSGTYDSPLSVSLSCAAQDTKIYYTLDGTAPDPTNINGSVYQNPIPLRNNSTLKAVAFRDGMASAQVSADYIVIRKLTVPGKDTLRSGESLILSSSLAIKYPNPVSQVQVVVAAASVPDPVPAGFDRLGPLLSISSLPAGASFTGLDLGPPVEGMAGISLYRRESDGSLSWMPLKDGALWIPSPGTYFWGEDTRAPRIRLLQAEAGGSDAVDVRFVLEDNVANQRWQLCHWSGKKDSTGWKDGRAGDTLQVMVPIPSQVTVPLEMHIHADDRSRSGSFPQTENNVFTLARLIPAFASPIKVASGMKWFLAGFPLDTDSPISLGDLGAGNGGGKFYGAVWDEAAATYRVLKDQDTLPLGTGIWLASEGGAPALALPTLHTRGSDSEGYFPMRLHPGWNQVTSPSLRPLLWPVSRQDGDGLRYLQSPLKGLLADSDTGWVEADTLQPWHGYLVHYKGADTLIHVGNSPIQPTRFLTKSAPSTPDGIRMRLRGTDGPNLDLGAYPWALKGLGNEDEFQPPPRHDWGGMWLAREKRRLASDYVRWGKEAGEVLHWTLVARTGLASSRVEVLSTALPEGFEAWAAAPSRRMKYRLGAEGGFPVQAQDTLEVYVGTSAALAAVPDLRLSLETPGNFRYRIRRVSGGGELTLALPSQATVEIRLWSLRGSRVGWMRRAGLQPGFYAWSLPASFTGPGGKLAAGVYLVEMRVEGRDLSFHKTEKLHLGW